MKAFLWLIQILENWSVTNKNRAVAAPNMHTFLQCPLAATSLIGSDFVDFHRDLKKGKIIAPKATATGAGAVGCLVQCYR